jgi:GTP cyclohydrolase II
VALLHSVPAGIGPAGRRFGLSLLRLAAGVTVLWFLVRQVGAAPFKEGLRAVTWQAVVAAVTLTALTTVCSAWRWRVVARALGVDIGLLGAACAYYRSLFLNSVLPGGVLGDVHRAVTHGRRAGDVARGVRAVAWERLCGQVIQAVVTAVVLLTLPSPVRPALPYVLAGVAGVAGVAGCAALVVRGAARRSRSRLTRAARAVAADLRRGLLAPGVWPQVTLASVLVFAGHTATFVIAARVAGCTAPLGELVALLVVVQTVVVIPLSIGGWGLREGAAAWAFAAAGLGAANGVTVAILYAVLMLVAVAPGAGLLLGDAVRRRRGPGHSAESREPDPMPPTREAVRALPGVPSDRPPVTGAVQAATIRRRIRIPLRLADDYSTTATVVSFTGLTDAQQHVALEFGRPGAARLPLVRLHSECLTGDVFGSQRCDCGPQLREAVERITELGGYVLYLRQEGRGIGLYDKLDAYALQDRGLDTYDANLALGHRADERDYTSAAQMLYALGANRIALLSNNPDKGAQLARLGITIARQVPTALHLTGTNAAYLATKAERGGHDLLSWSLERAVAEGPGQSSTVAEGPGQSSTVAEGPGQSSTAAEGPGQSSTAEPHRNPGPAHLGTEGR